MVKLFSTKQFDSGRSVIWVHRPKYLWYPRAAVIHARANGGPVLKTESSWRTVSGFLFRLRRRVVFVQFRRFCRR